MPVALDRADRRLVIGAFIFLVALVVVSALVEPQPLAGPEASSYSPAANGAKAAYTLLDEMGYHVERWEVPFAQLPHDARGVVLILAEPDLRSADKEETDSLRRFVESGGRLVATGAAGADALPMMDVTRVRPLGAMTQTYPAAAPSRLNFGAAAIYTEAPVSWQSGKQPASPLYAKEVHGEENIPAVHFTLGQGDVIWLASPTTFTNDSITRESNLNFFLNMMGSRASARILWDEYYHGSRESLGSYIAGTPILWALAQGGLIYILLIVGYGRRTGPLRKPVVESRLSPLEFVETLGALYHRAHASESAVETEWQRFRFLMTRRLGLPVSATVQEIYAGIRDRLRWSEPGLFETLQSAQRASSEQSISEPEALRLVSSLEHYVGLLQLNPRVARESTSWQNK
jgi:Domain of unknown function (DUF4350)